MSASVEESAATGSGVTRTPGSLQRLLATWLLAPLIVLVPLAAALQYALTLRPALEALDHGLGDTALSLGNLIHADAAGQFVLDVSPQTETALRTDRRDAVMYAVMSPDGRLLGGDPALADFHMAPTRATRDGHIEWRFVDASLHGTALRVALYQQPCGDGLCEVRVAETTTKRQLAERDAALAAGLSMTGLAAVLIVLMFVAIRRGLAPLERVGDQLAERSLERLQPLEATDAPAEVQPLVDAINQMLTRLRIASEAQRSFIAAAAHQLRTPLTALRTEAELILLEPHPPAMSATLTRLAQSSARAARLVAQLLALARAEAAALEPMIAVDLKQLAHGAAAEWVPRALEAGIDLGFAADTSWVLGRPLLLQEMLANVLHNALQYAGRAARVTVRTGSDGEHAVLEVEDSGPGIPAGEREAVFDRFYRGHPPAGAGSGLGLAIVRDIAASHGARVELLDGANGSGLRVRVLFPLAQAPRTKP